MSEQPDVLRAFQTIIDALAEGMKRMVDNTIPVIVSIHKVMWKAYRQAEMPYGDSEEGLMHWIKDLGEIKRHEAEIERIRQHHQNLIDFRRIGEEVRAKREERTE